MAPLRDQLSQGDQLASDDMVKVFQSLHAKLEEYLTKAGKKPVRVI